MPFAYKLHTLGDSKGSRSSNRNRCPCIQRQSKSGMCTPLLSLSPRPAAYSSCSYIHVLMLMHSHACPFPPSQAGGPQLVLLDHGLYKEISDAFRLEYAGLWRSLIFADEEGIRRHSAAMNAGAAYDVFASMLTQRPWDQVGAGAD